MELPWSDHVLDHPSVFLGKEFMKSNLRNHRNSHLAAGPSRAKSHGGPWLFLSLVALGFWQVSAAPVEIVPPSFRGAVQPQVAVARGGKVHVVFGKENSVYHISSSDGKLFSAPVKVGELTKLALRLRRGPRIAATDDRLLVTAISHADGDLHAWSSSDDGATWREEAPLNSVAASAREGLQALAGNGRGLVVAAWLDDRAGGKELWSRTSHDGGATWQDDARVYASPDGHVCECCHPSLALGSHGEMTAMWRNSLGGARDLWQATSTDGGRTYAPAQKLGTGTWKSNACPMDGGGLAFGPMGLESTWRCGTSIFTARPGEPEAPLAEHAAQPVIAFGASERLLAWEEVGQIRFQRGVQPARTIAQGSAPALASIGETVHAFLSWEAPAGGVPSLFAAVLP